MSTPTRKMYLSGQSGSVKKKKHSNADGERIFSMLKEIQTEHRSELANDTICSLICAKQNQNMECYEYCPDSEVLKKALTLIGVL